MINIIKPIFEHADERGKLVQLCRGGYEQINVLYNNAGTVRGGHYHKISRETFFVLSGSVHVELQKELQINTEKTLHKFACGDFFVIEPLTVHSLFFPEDCVLVVLYDKCVELENGEKDIYEAKDE